MIDKEILNMLQDDILIMNKQQKILFCNKHLLTKLKYDSLDDQALQVIIEEDTVFEKQQLHKKDILIAFKDREGCLNQARVDIIGREDQGKKIYWLIVKYWVNENYTKQELEMILDHMPLSVWIEDFRGKYRYTNDTNIRLINLMWGGHVTKKDFYKMNAVEAWKNKVKIWQWEEDNKKILQGEIINARRSIYGKGDHPGYTITKLPIYEKNGKVKSVISFKSSRTELRRAEEDLIEDYRKNMQFAAHTHCDKEEKRTDQNGGPNYPNVYYYATEELGICEYDAQENKLRVAASIGKHKEYLEEIEKLSVTPEEYRCFTDPMLSEQCSRLNDMLFAAGLTHLIQDKSKYVIHYPILYKEQCFGLLIGIYRTTAVISIVDVKELEDSAHNLGMIINNIKLSERVKQELVLRKQAERQVDEIFDTSMGLYSIYNAKSRSWKANVGWTKLLGWTFEKLEERTGVKTIYSDDRDELIHRLDVIKNGGSVGEMVSRFNCKAGGYKWIRWKGKFSQELGTAVIFGIDVTDEVKSIEQRQSYKKALELETSKNEFLANMSHELKTPLNIMYGIMQITEMDIKKLDSEEITKEDILKLFRYGEIMKQNVFRLLRLINNIVDISKIGAGAYSVNLQNCNIVEVVEDITMSVVEYTKGANIEIIFDTQEEEIETACDIGKMERIMLNLLSNAVKYSKEMGHILVNVCRRGEQVVIEVSDDGIGIPEGKQKAIFDRFVQVDQSFTRRCEGSGIGLSLVKSLVEMMQGIITVRSVPDEGSTFTVTLPIRRVEESKQKKVSKNVSTVNSRIEKCHIEFSDIYSKH